MYESIIIKMVAIASNRYETKPFWGLVEQVGPWKTTPSDRQRSKMKDHPTIGGGVEAGGREHAGHGEWTKIFTPYQLDASPSLPKTSDYAMRSVVTGPTDMKRQTKMGRVKKGLTMAARTPTQSGGKMGMSNKTENIEMGQRLGTEAGQVLPNLVIESYRSESDYGLPSLEQTAPFLSEHQIAETHEWMNNSLARELHREVMEEPKPVVSQITQTSGPVLSIQKTSVQSYKPKRGVQATQTRERTFHEFGTQVAGTAAASTLGFITGNVPGAMIAGKRTWDYLSPNLDIDTKMEIKKPRRMGPGVKVEQQVVPTFKPPPINLSLSESFMKSIINYEEGQKSKRKEKMEKGIKERKELVKDRKAVPVPTGQGKKIAMSAKALGKVAEKRGLPEAAKAAGIIPEKPMKTDGIKIKPLKKKTVTGSVSKKTQPVTQKVIKALRKRIGDSKINQMVKAMKDINPQYKIFKAANQQWLKEK